MRCCINIRCVLRNVLSEDFGKITRAVLRNELRHL